MSIYWVIYAIVGCIIAAYGFWLKYKDEKKH